MCNSLIGAVAIFTAIDIIIGGPPCTDYSGINANAQGPQGAQGQFLPRFADFIQNVRTKQPGHQVYFLVENVVFTDSDRLVNYNMIEKKLGVVETVHDALYFSPCARKRSFWLNVRPHRAMFNEMNDCLSRTFSLI